MTRYLTRRQIDAKVAQLYARELYDDPLGSRDMLRTYFLSVYRRTKPEIDRTLLELATLKVPLKPPPARRPRRGRDGVRPGMPLIADHAVTDRKLDEWAVSHNLMYEDLPARWVLARARKVLERAMDEVLFNYKQGWSWLTVDALLWLDGAWKTEAVVAFDIPPPKEWRPNRESLQDHMEYMKRDYYPSVRTLVDSHGWTVEPSKGAGTPQWRKDASRWLARRLAGESVSQIAPQPGKMRVPSAERDARRQRRSDRERIRQDIVELAQILELDMPVTRAS